MAVITYNHHTIISEAVYDEDTGRWKFSASVSWPEGIYPRGVRFLTNSPEFLCAEDAEQAGLEVGKSWVESFEKKAPGADFEAAPNEESPRMKASLAYLKLFTN
jgi:hypothetical protein